MMIQIEPHGFLKKTFDLQEQGWPAGKLTYHPFSERGEIIVGSLAYRAYRRKFFGPFLLERNGSIIAKAVKPSIFLSKFMLTFDQQNYELRKVSAFKSTFGVTRGAEEIGRIGKKGVISPKMWIDLPDSWPLPVRAFAFWLVLIIWTRERNS